jgi:hypothetical protein
MKEKIIHIKYSDKPKEVIVSGRIRTTYGDQLAQMEFTKEMALLWDEADKLLSKDV